MVDIVGKHARSRELLRTMAFVLWGIWKCCNEAVFKGVDVQANVAVDLLLLHIEEFNEAHGVTPMKDGLVDGLEDTQDSFDATWTCPPSGYVKLNCDSA